MATTKRNRDFRPWWPGRLVVERREGLVYVVLAKSTEKAFIKQVWPDIQRIEETINNA